MDITEVKKYLERYTPGTGMYNTLGIEFHSTPEPDTCQATMPVNEKTVQAFGYLCGGATAALAEILAGVGSATYCPGRISFGMSLNCNHIRPVKAGQTVTATAKLIHPGYNSHVWQVEIRDQAGNLASSATVTNFVTEQKI